MWCACWKVIEYAPIRDSAKRGMISFCWLWIRKLKTKGKVAESRQRKNQEAKELDRDRNRQRRKQKVKELYRDRIRQ